MLNNKTIAVVVLAYNEETQIGMVIETMPEFVDRIIIVNDKSNDKTDEIVNVNLNEDRIILINHKKNACKSAGIATGYKWAKDRRIDCIATIDGDGQMNPDEVESICLPVIEDGVEYVKGNRLIHSSALLVIPKDCII